LYPLAPPSLGEEAFLNTNCFFFIPTGAVDTYKSDESWRLFADRIKPL
jgi:hypothetical protein